MLGRQTLGVQFRIAAAEVHEVHPVRQGGVGQRRKGHDLRPGGPQQVQVIGIIKAEGRVFRQRDAHAAHLART